jgi:potassium/hydrogen antiporter
MASVAAFGAMVLTAAAVIITAALFSRVSALLRIPAPAFFLLGAATASNLWPRLLSVSHVMVEDSVTVALAGLAGLAAGDRVARRGRPGPPGPPGPPASECPQPGESSRGQRL